jgi:hypothetical protein
MGLSGYYSPGHIDGATGGLLPTRTYAASASVRFRIAPQPRAPRVTFTQPPATEGIWNGLRNNMEIFIAKSSDYSSNYVSFLNVVNDIDSLRTATNISYVDLGEDRYWDRIKSIRNITTRNLNDALLAGGASRLLNSGDFVAIRTKATDRQPVSFPVIIHLP